MALIPGPLPDLFFPNGLNHMITYQVKHIRGMMLGTGPCAEAFCLVKVLPVKTSLVCGFSFELH